MKKILSLTFFLFIIASNINPLLAETYSQTFTKDDKTYIVTKTIEDGIITIETKVYDSSGNLLKTNIVTKEAKPSPVKEVAYPTKSVAPKPTSTLAPLKISPEPVEEKSTLEPKVSSYLQSKFPLEINSDSGNLIATTDMGDIEIKIKPSVVVKLAEKEGMNIISEVKLFQSGSELKYQITGSKKEKLLAIYEVYLPLSLTYNTDNANLEKTYQSSLTKLIDFLSF